MDRSELALPKMSIHLKISEGFYHVFSRSAERTDGGRTCHPWSQDGGRTRTAACGGPQKPTPYTPWNCHRTADRLTPPHPSSTSLDRQAAGRSPASAVSGPRQHPWGSERRERRERRRTRAPSSSDTRLDRRINCLIRAERTAGTF